MIRSFNIFISSFIIISGFSLTEVLGQNSFYIASNAQYSAINNGEFERETNFNSNFSFQYSPKPFLIIEGGFGYGIDSNEKYEAVMVSGYNGWVPSNNIFTKSYQLSNKSYRPFIALNYLYQFTDRLSLGFKLKSSYIHNKSELQYGEQPTINNQYLLGVYATNSFNELSGALSPFFRFFIWERFGLDILIGGLTYTKFLDESEIVYIGMDKGPSDFEFSLSPSNWTFGLFWKINK